MDDRPTRLQSRSYAGEDDYALMRRMLVETYARTGSPSYCTVGDLDWWRCTANDPDEITRARLWFDGERLAGFVWPGKEQVDLMVHPDYLACEPEMAAWAEGVWAARLPAPKHFHLWSWTGDARRNAWLAASGYRRTGEFLSFHDLDLTTYTPDVRLPAGYRVRNVRGEEDVAARVDVHRAAFHPSRMTVEKHRAVMQAPTYRPELDLVVEAPDGTFAAFTIVWLDTENCMGLFEPVGCRPSEQRKGLARAVMNEGLRRLQEAGARVAHVGSWMDDSAGAMLYKAIGFTLMDRVYMWEKDLV
jgi:predicted N-acetyltransferase YhbS